MSGWTHRYCEACYAKAEPGRVPTRLKDPDPPDLCCSCGKLTSSGIYYRHDPGTLLCGGIIGFVHEP